MPVSKMVLAGKLTSGGSRLNNLQKNKQYCAFACSRPTPIVTAPDTVFSSETHTFTTVCAHVRSE
eukprot:6194444-Amphidinium_carterae.1